MFIVFGAYEYQAHINDAYAGMCAIGVHHCMGLGLIGVRPKDVATKAQRMYYELCLRDSDHARTVSHN